MRMFLGGSEAAPVKMPTQLRRAARHQRVHHLCFCCGVDYSLTVPPARPAIAVATSNSAPFDFTLISLRFFAIFEDCSSRF